MCHWDVLYYLQKILLTNSKWLQSEADKEIETLRAQPITLKTCSICKWNISYGQVVQEIEIRGSSIIVLTFYAWVA